MCKLRSTSKWSLSIVNICPEAHFLALYLHKEGYTLKEVLHALYISVSPAIAARTMSKVAIPDENLRFSFLFLLSFFLAIVGLTLVYFLTHNTQSLTVSI